MLQPRMKQNAPILILIGLEIAVLAAWWPIEPWAVRFETVYTTLNTIGRMAALMGATMIGFGFLLNLRLPVFDRWFDGLNITYRLHHRIGSLGYSLIVFHPVLVAMRYVPISWKRAASLLLPSTDIALLCGITAMLLLTTLIVTTIYFKFAYHHWRMIHRLSGVAIVFIFLHILLIPSDVALPGPLRYILLTLFGIDIIAYIYRVILGRSLARRTNMVVESIRPLTQDSFEISFRRSDSAPYKYRAGQYAFVRFSSPFVRSESQPFSFSSAPTDPGVRIGVKKLGDNTRHFDQLTPGTKAVLEGPFGTFYYQPASWPEIWIAGGIGITPFVGMLRAHVHTHPNLNFFYSVTTQDEAAYSAELSELSKQNLNVHFHLHLSSVVGHLTAERVLKMSGQKEPVIYVCGPPPMMTALRQQFKTLGIPSSRIRDERFDLV